MKSILEEIYWGNICPSENLQSKGAEYHRLLKKLCNQQNRLIKTIERLNPELAYEVEQIIDKQYELSEIDKTTIFTNGFCLGSRIMLEVYEKK